MDNDEMFRSLQVLLAKYRKNIDNVSAEDLEGKYRNAFLKLKHQIVDEANAWLVAYVFSDITVMSSDAEQLSAKVREYMSGFGIENRMNHALFVLSDAAALRGVADELREAVLGFYGEYLKKHTCLCAEAECFDPEKPRTPKIYNDILRKFFDERKGAWRDALPGETDNTVMIFFKEGNDV